MAQYREIELRNFADAGYLDILAVVFAVGNIGGWRHRQKHGQGLDFAAQKLFLLLQIL